MLEFAPCFTPRWSKWNHDFTKDKLATSRHLGFHKYTVEVKWGAIFPFHVYRIHAVIAIQQLDYASTGVSNCSVILCWQILQSFHQTTRHVPCFGCFHLKFVNLHIRMVAECKTWTHSRMCQRELFIDKMRQHHLWDLLANNSSAQCPQ